MYKYVSEKERAAVTLTFRIVSFFSLERSIAAGSYGKKKKKKKENDDLAVPTFYHR